MGNRGKSLRKKVPEWVEILEDNEEGLSNKFPLNIIKSHQKLSEFVHAETFTGGKEIIAEDSEVNSLFILAKGSVAVGDSRKFKQNKIYWIEKTTLKPFSVLGELEIAMNKLKSPGGSEPKTFQKSKPTQSAWASSETLKWLAAYTEEERKTWGEKAILLKIPAIQIQAIWDVQILREHILFDLLCKSRAYYLPKLEGVDTDAYSIAKHYRNFYDVRIAMGCDINKEVFIFGATRYNVLKPGTQYMTKDFKGFKAKTAIKNHKASKHTAILEHVIDAAKKEEKLEIKIISKNENLDIYNKLPQSIKKIFITQKSKHEKTKRAREDYICIDESKGSGFFIMSLKLLS